MRKTFELLKSYKKRFDFKIAKTFFKYENKNHIINLIFDVELSYEPLYTLFKIELHILKNYLLKNLILNCIRKFTNRANVSMHFVFINNNNLRLYIDFKKLNIFIIKNKCSFSLIDETFNRLGSTANFI